MTEFRVGDIIKIERGVEGEDNYMVAIRMVTRDTSPGLFDFLRGLGFRLSKLERVATSFTTGESE